MGDQDTQDETSYAGQADRRAYDVGRDAILADDRRAEGQAYQRGYAVGLETGRLDAGGGPFALLTAGVHIPAGASTERERNTERRHREEIAKALARPVADEPSDYEVWAKALDLAVRRLGRLHRDREELLDLAEWFWARLGEVPVRASDDDDDPFRPDLGDVD